MLNENWCGSDINIYILIDDDEYLNIERFLIDEILLAEYSGDFCDGYEDQRVKWIKNYVNDNNKIQIIGVSHIYQDGEVYNFFGNTQASKLDLIKIFINSAVDFDICNNVYYYDGKDNLLILNLDGVFTKTTNYISKPYSSIYNSISRYHKYKDRGFSFRNDKKLSLKNLTDDDRVHISLQQSYVNNINEIVKFFGRTDLHNICSCDLGTMEESECVNNKFPYLFPNDGKCYTKSCVVKFVNENLKHYHFKIAHVECHFKYSNSIVIL